MLAWNSELPHDYIWSHNKIRKTPARGRWGYVCEGNLDIDDALGKLKETTGLRIRRPQSPWNETGEDMPAFT